MEQINLTALAREGRGKGPARRLRAAGKVPAVLYGSGIEGSITLSLNNKELEKVLHTGAGSNVLVSLSLEGEGKPRTVMFKEITRNPVRHTIEHVDLVEIVMGTKLTVEVPIHVTGKSEGVAAGGTLHLDHRTVEIECLPSQIPDSIDVDVTALSIGESFHVSDLKLGEGLTVLTDSETTLVSIVPPTVEAEPVTAEEAEAEISESFEAAEEAGEEKGGE